MTLLIVVAALLAQDPVFKAGDPGPALTAAKKKAASDNKRILAVAGSNDSEPSLTLAKSLKTNRELSRLILYEYEVLLVDSNPLTGKAPAQVPWVQILDAEGKELAGDAASADSKDLVELLKKHKAAPLDAKKVLEAAMKKAGEEKKRVLLTFGAPW